MAKQNYWHGVIKLSIKGRLIEPFLEACTKRGCQISDIKRTSEEEVTMVIRLQDWHIYRSLRKKYRCKLKVIEGKGVPFLAKSLMRRTFLMIAFISAVLFVFLLANTLWSIKIEGLNPELEVEVEEQLNKYGVSPGRLSIGMSDPNEIQQRLLDDIPDLLWVGVKKQGTSYQLYGVEKTTQDKKESDRPTNLVATKKGMVIRSFIKQGRPVVSVYDVVKKGQLLATGRLVEDGDKYVRAEGEVIAETWYMVEQSIPDKHMLHLNTGVNFKSYYLKIGNRSIPLWGWWKGKEGKYRKESNIHDWNLFGWEFPLKIQNVTSYKIDDIKYDFSKDQLRKVGIKSARNNIKQHLKSEAIIKDEKVLHLGLENGKVKLILLFKVHENIAKTKYISQGD